MPRYQIEGQAEPQIADEVKEIECPCCKSKLLVGFSEWFNFVADASKIKEIE